VAEPDAPDVAKSKGKKRKEGDSVAKAVLDSSPAELYRAVARKTPESNPELDRPASSREKRKGKKKEGERLLLASNNSYDSGCRPRSKSGPQDGRRGKEEKKGRKVKDG